MIRNIKDKLFVLDTKHTTYAFRVLPTGQLEHLYYGAKITVDDSGDGEAAGLAERHAFSPGTSSNYNDEEKRYTLDDMRLEYSAPGKGDLREPAVVVRHADGARTSDFVFRKAEMRTGTVELAGMPTSYDPGDGLPTSRDLSAGKNREKSGEKRGTEQSAVQGAGQNSEMGSETAGDRQSADVKAQRPIGIGRDAVGSLADDEPHGIKAQTLTITMYDAAYNLELKLNYTVYPACDIITRSAVLKNCSEATVSVERLMSLCLDFDAEPYIMSTFNGAWAREMRRTDSPLAAGKLVNATTSGISSNRANPFVMLSKPYTTEDHGEVYAFNLIYSGNHYEAAEVSPFGKLRFVSGINPEGFCWQLAPGAEFAAPEAVMTYSDAGEPEYARLCPAAYCPGQMEESPETGAAQQLGGFLFQYRRG